MANTNAIDPDGDILFVYGETEIQVSSKVLGLASPVFKALFGPNLAEGQPGSSKVGRIQLYDDDAESMRLMCAVLHQKCACINGIGLERLERLAVVTDKYDIVQRTRRSPAVCSGRLMHLAILTRFMVLNLPNDGKVQSASAKYGVSEEIENHLPDSILETLFLAERNIKRELQIQIEQIISPIAEKRATGDFVLGSDDVFFSHCDCISISLLINGLSRQGLWPLESAVHRLSISTLCRKLEVCATIALRILGSGWSKGSNVESRISTFGDYHGSFQSQKEDDRIQVSAKRKPSYYWKAEMLG